MSQGTTQRPTLMDILAGRYQLLPENKPEAFKLHVIAGTCGCCETGEVFFPHEIRRVSWLRRLFGDNSDGRARCSICNKVIPVYKIYVD